LSMSVFFTFVIAKQAHETAMMVCLRY